MKALLGTFPLNLSSYSITETAINGIPSHHRGLLQESMNPINVPPRALGI